MTDTKKRIDEYSKKLPKMKEKVVAAIALLIVGAAMMTTVSFAWVAISVNPEVSGVNTSIASNGNLEIALATGNRIGAIGPGETEILDSNVSLVDRNITWGNLINLSDPAYGLDKLVLRPAQLNTSSSALTSPLSRYTYTADGRKGDVDSSFSYTKWDAAQGKFVYDPTLGVCAISSVIKTFEGANAEFLEKIEGDNGVNNINSTAGAQYRDIAEDSKKMGSLATMMGLYMTSKMAYDTEDQKHLKNPTFTGEDVGALADMYEDLLKSMEKEAEAIAETLNLQLYALYGGNYDAALMYTKEKVLALDVTDTNKFKEEGDNDEYISFQYEIESGKKLQIKNLGWFIKDYNMIKTDLEKLRAIENDTSKRKWTDSGLDEIVNHLVNVGECTIGADNQKIGTLGATDALNYISGTQEARITNGILYRYEERTGSGIDVKGIKISVTIKRDFPVIGEREMSQSVSANVKTTAPIEENLFKQDVQYTKSLLGTLDESKADIFAMDTYGLAVDLWVRTNAFGSFLTLSGNVLTETREFEVTGPDMDGNIVNYYTVEKENATVQTDSESGTGSETEDDESDTLTIYKIETKAEGSEETVEQWYQVDTNYPVTLSNGVKPNKKVELVEVVVGYTGDDRIWDGSSDQAINISSATQGSGSCYVFYPENSEDQERAIELLKNMKVAFVDGDGKLLATAIMDTNMRYEQPGKVTIPLKLDSESISLGKDANGNEMYAITALEKNVATRITAIVYLDGSPVGNEEVLSVDSIQGHLNIQFSSTAALSSFEDKDLQNKKINVKAEIEDGKDSFEFDEEIPTTKVYLTINGDTPSDVKAYFIRKISDTHGAREEVAMDFKYDESIGKWWAEYTFAAPGNYVLRNVQIDGIERALSVVGDNYPTVEVKGFSIKTITMSGGTYVLTGQSSHIAPMTLEFATDDVEKMPDTVEARFRRDDGTVTAVIFNRDSLGKWHGTAEFRSSGTYKLTSIYLDDLEYSLAGNQKKELTLLLGVNVYVDTTSPTDFKLLESEMTEAQKKLQMKVFIRDNEGNEMENLSNVTLKYALQGSDVKKMEATLTWNGAHYVGEMDSLSAGAGIWKFHSVEIGENIITNTTGYPIFTMRPPEPPAFKEILGAHSYAGEEPFYVFAPNKDASFSAVLDYTSTADVRAIVVNVATNEEKEIIGVSGVNTRATGGNSTTWTFTIPKDSDGLQEGVWMIKSIIVWDYFNEDGIKIEEGGTFEGGEEHQPMTFEISSVYPNYPNGLRMKVVNSINVSFESVSGDVIDQTLGKEDDNSISGAFMQSHNISGLKVVITDNNREEIPKEYIGKITLEIQCKPDESSNYGGYKINSPDTNLSKFTIDFTRNASNGTTYDQKSAITLLYAGKYTPKLTIEITGGTTLIYAEEEAAKIGVPTYEVWSKTPSVKITAISPTGTFDVDASGAGEGHQSATVPAFTTTSATVYFKCSRSGSGSTCDPYRHNYSRPSVTITLDGIGYASQAVLNFGSDKHIYNGTTQTTGYSWTANGACARNIGYYKSRTAANDNKTPAGTLTCSILELTYNGVTYQVPLSTITINNPY